MKKKNLNRSIALDESDLKELKEFDVKLLGLKSQITEAYLQKHSADQALQKITETYYQVRGEYIHAAKRLAKNKGIDIDKPDQGNWTIDLSQMVLSKTN